MKKLLIQLILFYQRYLSPLKSTKCPYFPSCSQYGLEAVRQYGALKGGLLSVWRILRCNPFSEGGYDPVPSMKKSTMKESTKNSKDNFNGKSELNNSNKKLKTFYRF